MAIDALTFPRPRLRRTGPPSTLAALEAAAGGEVAPPRGRVISFGLTADASRRTTLALGPFVGPVLIRGISFNFDGASDPASNSLELGWAPINVVETNVVLTTVRPYTLLNERVDRQNVTAAVSGQGLTNWTVPNTHVRFQYQLHLIVTDPHPFICLGLVQGAAVGTLRCVGILTVLEAVNLEALVGFAG